MTKQPKNVKHRIGDSSSKRKVDGLLMAFVILFGCYMTLFRENVVLTLTSVLVAWLTIGYLIVPNVTNTVLVVYNKIFWRGNKRATRRRGRMYVDN